MTSNYSDLRIGFIGLGNLGLPMAQRLAEVGRLTGVWSRSELPRQAFHADVQRFSSPAGLAEQTDVVCVCLPDERDVREVLSPAVLDRMNPGAIVVVHSTIRPSACLELASTTLSYGVAVVDAPVCGGPPAAAAGALLLSAGGSPNDIERCGPIFSSIARMWRHVGPLGAGQRVKLLMNLLYAANVEIICEALEVGEQLGLGRDVLGEFIRTVPSSGFVGSFLATGRPGSVAIEHGRSLLRKDIDYAASLLDAHDIRGSRLIELGNAAIELLSFTQASDQSADDSAREDAPPEK